MEIIAGIIYRALRIVLYGLEGVGKSTLASFFPDPVFIDLENGTDNLNVKRLRKPADWQALIKMILQVALEKPCKTLVIDTIGRAEAMCISYICSKYGKSGIEQFGYGQGYIYLREEFENLIVALDKCVDAGINVLLIGHSQIRKFEQPDEMGAYDRHELKLTKHVAPRVKEWTDTLLFCTYKTHAVKTTSGTYKGTGGQRVIYTQHSPVYDAKNRQGLPPEIPMDYRYIQHIFTSGKSQRDQLQQLMTEGGVTESELVTFLSEKAKKPVGHTIADFDDSLVNWIIINWSSIKGSIIQ